MSTFKENGSEVTKIFEILNDLNDDRRRILFGDKQRFNQWLKDHGISDNVSALIRNFNNQSLKKRMRIY